MHIIQLDVAFGVCSIGVSYVNAESEGRGQGLAHGFDDLVLDQHQPIYVQLVRYIKMQIHLERFHAGDELPSRRVLATLLNINPATVQKAYKQLEEEGFIITLNNSKSVLDYDDASREQVGKELTEGEVKSFLQTAKRIRLSFKEVIDLISELWDQD